MKTPKRTLSQTQSDFNRPPKASENNKTNTSALRQQIIDTQSVLIRAYKYTFLKRLVSEVFVAFGA